MHTQQFDWSFEKHGIGLIHNASKRIQNGETIEFHAYDRNPKDSTEMNLVETAFIGIVILPEDNKKCLRVSNVGNLLDSGSHSIIPSWNEELLDDITMIALHIAQYFKNYSDVREKNQ